MVHGTISCHSCHPVFSFYFNWNSPAQTKLWELWQCTTEHTHYVFVQASVSKNVLYQLLLWHLRWGRRLSSPRHVLYKEHETEKTMFVTYWCLSALKMGAMFHPPCASPLLGRHAPCRCIIILIYALNQLCIQILLIACHFLSISLCAPVVGW